MPTEQRLEGQGKGGADSHTTRRERARMAMKSAAQLERCQRVRPDWQSGRAHRIRRCSICQWRHQSTESCAPSFSFPCAFGYGLQKRRPGLPAVVPDAADPELLCPRVSGLPALLGLRDEHVADQPTTPGGRRRPFKALGIDDQCDSLPLVGRMSMAMARGASGGWRPWAGWVRRR